MIEKLRNYLNTRKQKIEKEKAEAKAKVLELINKKWTNSDMILYSHAHMNGATIYDTYSEYNCKMDLLNRFHRLFSNDELIDLRIMLEKKDKERFQRNSESSYR